MREADPLAPEQAAWSAANQLREVQEIMGLSDHEVARALTGDVPPRGAGPQLTPARLYRLDLLHQLAVRLRQAGLELPAWLHRPSAQAGPSPFELICAGELREVRTAADALAVGLGDPDAPMRRWPAFAAGDESAEDRPHGRRSRE